MLPNLYLFNPTCEMAIANGNASFQAHHILQQFESDLAFLPSILSKNSDLILMKKYEAMKHLDLLHKISFPIPGQILETDIINSNQKILSDVKSFKPWGWAPNLIHKLQKTNVFSEIPLPKWSDSVKQIHSRLTAQKILKRVLESNSNLYISKENSPIAISGIEEIELFLNAHQQMVLKEPWSASGRGVIFLRKPYLNISIKQRLQSILKQQKFIMAEPLFEKKLDFSLHFEIEDKKLHYFGQTFFTTNSNGQYQSHFLNAMPQLEDSVLAFFKQNIKEVIHDLYKAILKSEIIENYSGFFGVDLMIVNENHKLVFQPCVEINLRNNMGTIALHIQNLIHPESKGHFHIAFEPNSTFESIYSTQQSKLQMADGLMVKGSLPIVAVQHKKFGAYIKLV